MIKLKRLLHSPFTLYTSVMAKIERETAHAQAGRPARIVAKLNALNEAHVIEALYRASQAGVEIDLIVRGACTLRPGLPGISERIRVRSIVGRFLEHSRVYWFANDGEPELYCASADWMERNLMRRIEVAFPILDPELAARVFEETLANSLADNTQAWLLAATAATRAPSRENPPYSAQQSLLERFCPCFTLAQHCVVHRLTRARARIASSIREASRESSRSTPIRDGELIAAVDMGSNSFHMVVARMEHGEPRVIDRLRDSVRMAAGLRADGTLDAERRARALNCLARFGQRIAGLPSMRVRAVATNTVRRLASPQAFLTAAESALGHPIEVVSGREEGRLIFLGAAHDLPASREPRLVIDVGGGSTEFIIGRGLAPLHTESVQAGCIASTCAFSPAASSPASAGSVRAAKSACCCSSSPRTTANRAGRMRTARPARPSRSARWCRR
jgi:hypothetical protein